MSPLSLADKTLANLPRCCLQVLLRSIETIYSCGVRGIRKKKNEKVATLPLVSPSVILGVMCCFSLECARIYQQITPAILNCFRTPKCCSAAPFLLSDTEQNKQYYCYSVCDRMQTNSNLQPPTLAKKYFQFVRCFSSACSSIESLL